MFKIKKQNMHLEDDLQASCVKWFRMQYPHLTLFAIPNGGKRDVREAVRLKKQGVLKGVHDLFLMKMTKQYCGLFIEIKIGDNKLTKDQEEFALKAMREGHKVGACRTFEEFVRTIRGYLNTRI